MKARHVALGIGVLLFGLILVSCSPTGLVEPTSAPTEPADTPTPVVEPRTIELEWPSEIRLGDSDVVRLSLIPSETGYEAQLEFPEHELESEAVAVPFIAGYAAWGVARLDAAGIDFSPQGDQLQALTPGVPAIWRWTLSPQTAGRQRLSLRLDLRWVPLDAQPSDEIPQVNLWQRPLEIQVQAPLGLSAPQARTIGSVGMVLGGALTLPLAEWVARRRLARARARRLLTRQPDPDLTLETAPDLQLETEETRLLAALFSGYGRLSVDKSFASGYSGARTFLVRPIQPDGRTHAHAIVKIGSRRQIIEEYANYQTFVRHTLPPITGRVQSPPVAVAGISPVALQYTFVGAPGDQPISLREFALDHPADQTSRLLEERLFATFSPTWWMQRRPYTFRLGREYDRLLPVHFILEPANGAEPALTLDGDSAPTLNHLRRGDLIRLQAATAIEVRPERKTVTLAWPDDSGAYRLRVRLQGFHDHGLREGQVLPRLSGRLAARRSDLLQAEARRAFADLDPHQPTWTLAGRSLPNPLATYEALLEQEIQATSSVIHGDLNLENVLVGPGDLVWLIDFAATREGHTLFDFARLEVEITTQVLAAWYAEAGLGPDAFLETLDRLDVDRLNGDGPVIEAGRLLRAVRRLAARCLYDPKDQTEYRQALALSYLGALKFANLDLPPLAPLPKQLALIGSAWALRQEKREWMETGD